MNLAKFVEGTIHFINKLYHTILLIHVLTLSLISFSFLREVLESTEYVNNFHLLIIFF